MSEPGALEPLFDPRAVAVVGASDDPVKWGHWLAVRALRGEHRRSVHLVNRRGGTVLGREAYPSLLELPGPIDLAVLAVPAAGLERAVADSIAAGARAIVAISGVEEDGDAGGARDAALARVAREAGVRLLGPNCLGVFDAAAELELVSNDLPRGELGLVSQSGNLALEIGLHAERVGLGFSRFASVGNQADLTMAELVRELAGHEPTRAIAVYAEDFRDGREFARAAAEAGKPVVLLAIEQGEATSRAVRSHTGALASDGDTIDAACRAAGIARVHSPQELVDVAEALLHLPRPRGRRVAVLADGGGHGGVAAGLAQRAGLEVPPLDAPLVARLRAELPPAAATGNPVDLAGGGEQDIVCFERTVRILLGSGEVDSVLMTGYFGGYALYDEGLRAREVEVARGLAKAVSETGRPLFVHSMHPDGPATAALRAGGVPVQPAVERAVGTLARLAEPAGGAGVPAMPPAGERVADTGYARVPAMPPAADPVTDTDYARVPAMPPAADPVAGTTYTRVRELLAAGGVPFVAAAPATTADEAVAAARELGYPVALKALGLLHKSDAGGVVLGVDGDAALAAAAHDLIDRLAPPALSVERMAPAGDGVELIAGARWDARFGPTVLVGLGGLYTEILRDTRVALAPVDAAGADELLRALRCAPLLLGARGRPPVHLRAAAEAVAALSRIAAAHPELAELEVNPLLVTPDGALALDARAMPR
jgi:acyl-CoA synthetase (NDP forming)